LRETIRQWQTASSSRISGSALIGKAHPVWAWKQRKAVGDYLNGGRWQLVAEFVETESGSKADRPKLAEALALARAHGAKLVIAKIDRLSRDAAFLLGMQNAGVQFVAADMPEANEMIVGIMAVVAQAERKMI
jgi:DNA invertase Pin-like site-specific DNA recombinase